MAGVDVAAFPRPYVMREFALGSDKSGRDEKGRGDAYLFQQRPSLGEIVSVAVIESDHHGASPHRLIGADSFAQLFERDAFIPLFQVCEFFAEFFIRFRPNIAPADSVVIQNDGAGTAETGQDKIAQR